MAIVDGFMVKNPQQRRMPFWRASPSRFRKSSNFLPEDGTYVDRMRPGHAFFGPTNPDVTSLTERLIIVAGLRFQSVRLQRPDNEVLAAFLAMRWCASHRHHSKDRRRGQRERQCRDGGFGDVNGVKAVARAGGRTGGRGNGGC